MNTKWFILAMACACAAAVWAADVATDNGGVVYTGGPSVAAGPGGTDATLELAWDNGSRRWALAWYTGAGSWAGNDFNTNTLTGKSIHVKILKFRMLTCSFWPNTTWDGVRIGFYNFSGGVPGSMIWPTSGAGYFFKPSTSNTGHIWVECDINWTCPVNTFVAAEEQYYNYPSGDPYEVDTNPTFRGHSWQYYGGTWSNLSSENIAPYFNLMVRVQVETGQTFPGIAPTSMGRVKALYF